MIIEIPDNATNGDVVKLLFNPYRVTNYDLKWKSVYITESDWDYGVPWRVLTSWWNATYNGLKYFDDSKGELEYKDTDDCISRKEAINLFRYNYKGERIPDYDCDNFPVTVNIKTVKDMLRKLSPVQPEQRTGKWISPVCDDGMSDPIYYQVRCSNCGFALDPQTYHQELKQYGADKFCPRCGAKMQVDKENK